MRNLRDTIFYMKKNVLQDFDTCISVPLSYIYIPLSRIKSTDAWKMRFIK